jgi:hypothetical protein
MKNLHNTKFAVKAIKQNLVTAYSTAKEISARINYFLQTVQFIADSWGTVDAKTNLSCCAHCNVNHSDLEIPNKDVRESRRHVGDEKLWKLRRVFMQRKQSCSLLISMV